MSNLTPWGEPVAHVKARAKAAKKSGRAHTITDALNADCQARGLRHWHHACSLTHAAHVFGRLPFRTEHPAELDSLLQWPEMVWLRKDDLVTLFVDPIDEAIEHRPGHDWGSEPAIAH